MLSPGDIVRIYPESVALLADDISTVAYGTVRRVRRRLVIDVTPDESIPEPLSLTVAASNDQFPVVTAAERDAGTHRLMRRFVAARVGDNWVHGQVCRADQASRSIQVRTHRGRLTMSQDAVALVLPVVAALLWDTDWSAVGDDATRSATGLTTEALLECHQRIWHRIRPLTALEAPSRDIAAILAGYDVSNAVNLGAMRRIVCDPRSGILVNPCVQHIVDFAFHADGGANDPNIMELGESFCHDPSDLGIDSSPLLDDTEAATTVQSPMPVAPSAEHAAGPQPVFVPPPREGTGTSLINQFLSSVAGATATANTDASDMAHNTAWHQAGHFSGTQSVSIPTLAGAQVVSYAGSPSFGGIAPSVVEFAAEYQREHRARNRAAATRTLAQYTEVASGPQHSKSALRVSPTQAEKALRIKNFSFGCSSTRHAIQLPSPAIPIQRRASSHMAASKRPRTVAAQVVAALQPQPIQSHPTFWPRYTKDGGLPICLRHLSLLPCTNPVKDNKCTGFDGRLRSHNTPVPLADAVKIGQGGYLRVPPWPNRAFDPSPPGLGAGTVAATSRSTTTRFMDASSDAAGARAARPHASDDAGEFVATRFRHTSSDTAGARAARPPAFAEAGEFVATRFRHTSSDTAGFNASRFVNPSLGTKPPARAAARAATSANRQVGSVGQWQVAALDTKRAMLRTPFVITSHTVTDLQARLATRLAQANHEVRLRLELKMRAHGISAPPPVPASSTSINAPWVSALSRLTVAANLSPRALVELVRGQSPADYRPNKAMFPAELHALFAGHTDRDTIVRIATEGFRCPWTDEILVQDAGPPDNHGSACRHPTTLQRRLAEGQAAWQYLFVDESVQALWANAVFYSPLGLVEKNHQPLSVDGRLIHDLSFPLGASINSHTRKADLPLVEWPRIATVAARITWLRATAPPGAVLKGMSGDVAAAYRHLRSYSADSSHFGLSLPDKHLLGMDLSAPFGWCGSPNVYCVVGNAISWLVQGESPNSINPDTCQDTLPFWCFNYIDDFILIEIESESRLQQAESALRIAMLATLGPDAVNEKKFQPWATEFHALGLVWNLELGVVSMPAAKTARAQSRVRSVRDHGRATRLDMERLLGSLRHVCLCAPAARAFYQALHSFYRALPRFGARSLQPAARADLDVLDAILSVAHFERVPTSVFDNSSRPSYSLEMDASDTGIAIIDRQRRRFIRLVFDAEEQQLIKMAGPKRRPTNQNEGSTSDGDDFSINIREHLAIGLAVCLWGEDLKDPTGTSTAHIEALTDNTTALAWSVSLYSGNRYGANINRHIAVAQAVHRLHVSARHIPGCNNTLADAGSRASVEPFKSMWENETASWSETPIPSHMRHMYQTFDLNTLQPWLSALGQDTHKYGASGQHSAPVTASANSFPALQSNKTQHYAHSQVISSTGPTLQIAQARSEASWQSSAGTTSAHEASKSRTIDQQKRPVTFNMLATMRRNLDLNAPRSEYLAIDGKTASYAVEVGDVQFLDAKDQPAKYQEDIKVVQFHIRGSKTDQAGRGVHLRISPSPAAWLCPVAAALTLMQHAKANNFTTSTKLCSISTTETLSCAAVSSEIKQAAAACQEDPSHYSTHSLRSGGATALFRGGVPDLAIQKFGRWSSDAYKKGTASPTTGMADTNTVVAPK
ncbi:hypothetical protein SPRG_22230 [Saprolegnia parasitica CBS 223.65]|uniref:Reverse transcriptase domain-containing protein n=1 Tax=Saprolegnia parasitica (strain CBS 223.65) TaxID=695850 RepID=A0A067C452_SAPPC|nr:hypothetical protein SPRG_22230 [Saprolegnia parasitica CBS 223.65]KDO25559.1 hypothetical protein SPRG_22230 [Saprolegnia parasitica CBS 223.65]|eukprot:XP_012203797.1 hypothetical protein SPRG_22230 [Saprolegnia parasitica CBS 223.65]